jgi:hypothetical protein
MVNSPDTIETDVTKELTGKTGNEEGGVDVMRKTIAGS